MAERPVRYGRFVVPVLLLALGSAVMFATAGVSSVEASDPGADRYPQIIAAGIMILAVLLMIQRAPSSFQAPTREAALRVAGIVGLLALYYLTLKPLGYISATVILIAGGLLLMGVRRWFSVVTISVVFGIANFYLFYVGFGVPLPLSSVERFIL